MLNWIKKIFNLNKTNTSDTVVEDVVQPVVEVAAEESALSLPKIIADSSEQVQENKRGRKKKSDWEIDPPSSAGIKVKKPNKTRKTK